MILPESISPRTNQYVLGMVTYQKFVSIVFDVMDSDSAETSAELMSWAAEAWSDNKEELKTATVAEARDAVQRAL